MATNIQGTLDPNTHDFAVSATFSYPGLNNTTIDTPFNFQCPGYRYDMLVAVASVNLSAASRVGGPNSQIGAQDVARLVAKLYEVLNAPPPVPALQTYTAPDA